MYLSDVPFRQLLDVLHDADVNATMTPGEVNTPGCWLTLEEVAPRVLDGSMRLTCSLYLIAGDADALRALRTLGELLTRVKTVLTPDGPVTTTAVVLPSGPTPLPALRVPINLYT